LLPFPAFKFICPPVAVAAVVSPAVKLTPPPDPVFPVPALTEIAPAAPDVDSGEDIVIEPELPAEVVPLEMMTWPLLPAVPALAVLMVNGALVVETPMPLETTNEPPEED
jgi:hypothetical protein